MSIDCIEPLGDAADISSLENGANNFTTSLWNGRTVQHIRMRDDQYGLICHFFAEALRYIQERAASLSREAYRLTLLYINSSRAITTQTQCSAYEAIRKKGKGHHLSNSNFHFTSDRWDPMDANERVYGKGTHDGNTGILKSEIAEMQRQRDLFIEEIGKLGDCVDLTRLDALREKIETLRKEAGAKGYEALKELATGVFEALSAGVAIQIPPLAILSIWFAVDNFKDAAKDYLESLDIKKQIEGLLEMERSLEKVHENQRLSDRRG